MDTIDKILELMASKDTTAAQLTREIGLTNGLITQWKQRKQKPSLEKLTKIASYFDVPTDFLLGSGAFVCWEEINNNRKAFIDYAGIPADTLRVILGVTPENVDTMPLHDFVQFINIAIKDVTITADGNFNVKLKNGFHREKNKPSTEVEGLLPEAIELTKRIEKLSPANRAKLSELIGLYQLDQDKKK